MFAVSSISTMKVLWPVAISSCAPIRVKIRSTIPICAESAGTNEPIWAISVISATCRSQLLLPAMFGPVRMITWSLSAIEHGVVRHVLTGAAGPFPAQGGGHR